MQLGIAAQRENARVRGRLVGILIVVVCMAFVSLRVHFKGETHAAVVAVCCPVLSKGFCYLRALHDHDRQNLL